MTIYIGIDPGKTGAIAFLYCTGGATVTDLVDGQWWTDTLPSVATRAVPVRVLVEKPDGRPGKGVSAFTFEAGRRVGYWDRACPGCVHIINASVWTNALGVGRDKEASLELARKLFPELAPLLSRKKDHNRAQALLIAEYGRRNQL